MIKARKQKPKNKIEKERMNYHLAALKPLSKKESRIDMIAYFR
jgi:cytochrome c2